MIDKVTRESKRSVRRACRVLGIRRQTYYGRKGGKRPEERDEVLRKLLQSTCQRFVAWGFWMIFYYLRNEHALADNHKRVYRIWKEAELHLRVQHKRPSLRREYRELLVPGQINQGWAMDFVSDWVVGVEKKPVRIINIMDECSRKALWTEAHESISAKTLTEILDDVVKWRGAPQYIRCDNGPEFIARKLKDWAQKHGVELRHIQAGKPSQNGLIERLNKTLRVECLNLNWFSSMEELNESIQQWSVIYNQVRPHENLGYLSPMNYEQTNKNLYFCVVAA
ncbi:MAG: IS3 family transposase [Anaerolineae bacterium]|nr:IS3 family transposase [Anaerolineae bacterium]